MDFPLSCMPAEPADGAISKRLVLCALALLLAAVPALAKDWTWQLPAARYRELSVFQRAQYDKAAKLVEQSNYKAAAGEFEKFKVQFTDSPVLSYVLFMRGYCLHQAKFRNKAIKVYHEVLDYFGDDVDDAAPALYFMGTAHIENGDVRKGMACMREMADDEDYRLHPLAAGALLRLGDNFLKNKQPAQALKYWKQAVRDFQKTNHTEANKARQKVLTHYIKSKNYAGLDAWLVTAENRDDPQHRKRVAQSVMQTARNIFAHHVRHHYSRFQQKEKQQAMKACFQYFRAARKWYEKTDSRWHYYEQALTFLSQCYRDKPTRDTLVDELVAIVKGYTDKKQANAACAWIVDRLREAGDYLKARMCIALIDDPPLAAYKEHELLAQQHKWKGAVALLAQIEKMGDAAWAERALTQHANILKDHLAQYDKAILLYHQLARPPWTLWQIQDAYLRWGKLDKAIQTLSEIENSFPDEASKAAWHKALYYDEAKERKKAIAQARKILKAYKKSAESSLAHQLLEKYGIATGGGVFDEN